jgi:hypothetical protein
MKRYDLVYDKYNVRQPAYEEEREDGEYVKYEDVQKLQTELSALKRQVAEAEQSAQNWKFDCDQNVKWGLSMRALAETAEAALAALKKDARLLAEFYDEYITHLSTCLCPKCTAARRILEATKGVE